jgi:mannose-6-phosphate isomerase-like protein (cupin superfamily)
MPLLPLTPLITAAGAPIFELPGVRFTGLAAPSRGANESAVWIVSVDPRTDGTPHRLTREEVIVALDGRARATLAGVDYDIEAGSAFVVPPEMDFSLANPYEEPFRAVAVLPVGGEARIGDDTFIPPWAR